jgi:hypothetical protein
LEETNISLRGKIITVAIDLNNKCYL